MKPAIDDGPGIGQGAVSGKALKRPFVCLAIVLLAFAVLLLVGLNSGPANPPRLNYLPITVTASNVSYDFFAHRPFEGGRMTIIAISGPTNRQTFVFDIENRRVVGQLTNGWPEMLFGDQLLCAQAVPGVPIWGRLLAFLKPVLKKLNVASPDTEGAAYWLIDLQNNTAKWLGNIVGTGSEVPSPDFRYCFTSRFGPPVPHCYLFDLHKKRVAKLDAPGYACGWWDNSRILFETTNSDFVLYDVRTKATSPLITSAKLGVFLDQNDLTFGNARPHAFAIWNGRENDFYLTDPYQKVVAEESFLIKVERPDGRLKLLSPRFKFERLDHLDPTGRLYLYSGRTAGQPSDGVFLRHLDTGTNRVLVAPTTNKYFSIPRFYGDSVIYIRSNALWRIGLDGSNNVKLFPPDVRP